MGQPSDKETEAENDKPSKKPIWIWAVVAILKVIYFKFDKISIPKQKICALLAQHLFIAIREFSKRFSGDKVILRLSVFVCEHLIWCNYFK